MYKADLVSSATSSFTRLLSVICSVCNTCYVIDLCSYAEVLFEVPHVLHLPRTCC